MTSRRARSIGVAQVVDTLDAGGLERFARDVANGLPRDRFRSHLVTTRRSGPLAAGIEDHVETWNLGRRGRFDLPAILRLRRFLRNREIGVLHAHGHSLGVAVLATLGRPAVRLVWHVHSGAWASRHRPSRGMRWLARRASFVLTVTADLATWCSERLGVSAERVAYLPNFVQPAGDVEAAQGLPGKPGQRIVCVANLRPEKDHATLLDAFARVATVHTEAHLLLVGDGEAEARQSLERRIARAGLGARISLLGRRADVAAVLRGCDLAVLASASEGFPLVLLEYGDAALPTIATRVGQCAEILGDGEAGVLVPAGDDEALATVLGRGLGGDLADLGPRLGARVTERYQAPAILGRIADRYDAVVREPR